MRPLCLIEHTNGVSFLQYLIIDATFYLEQSCFKLANKKMIKNQWNSLSDTFLLSKYLFKDNNANLLTPEAATRGVL